ISTSCCRRCWRTPRRRAPSKPRSATAPPTAARRPPTANHPEPRRTSMTGTGTGTEVATTAAVVEGELSLLDRIISDGKMARDVSQRAYARDLIGEFVNQILADEKTISKDSASLINERIAEIDHLISAQLNEVMHAADFQQLEGSWRG